LTTEDTEDTEEVRREGLVGQGRRIAGTNSAMNRHRGTSRASNGSV